MQEMFCFLYIKARRVLLSRDIQWMGHYYGEEKGVLPHWILIEIDDDDDEADHRDIEQVSDNDIVVAEPKNDVEIGNDIENVHDKVEYNNPANAMDMFVHDLCVWGTAKYQEWISATILPLL